MVNSTVSARPDAAATTRAEPGARAVTRPAPSTEARASSSEVKLKLCPTMTLPNWSRSEPRTRSVSPTPRKPDSGMATMLAAGPGSTVAMKGAGLTPFTCALSRAVPAVMPTVHDVVAMPRESVVLLAGLAVPDPTPTSQSTRRPETGLLSLSVTSTASAVGSAAPATAVCWLPA